jgi:hypothetical protein
MKKKDEKENNISNYTIATHNGLCFFPSYVAFSLSF